VDTVTKTARSRIMSSIRSVSRLELRARRACERRAACRLRHNGSGRGPDFVNRARRVAVFVHGCFWHGCPAHYRAPKSNRAFWRAKLRGNVARDRRTARELRREGWRVLAVWEHSVR
jgi:DNA mismatch endonuclease (patch repair protein)